MRRCGNGNRPPRSLYRRIRLPNRFDRRLQLERDSRGTRRTDEHLRNLRQQRDCIVSREGGNAAILARLEAIEDRSITVNAQHRDIAAIAETAAGKIKGKSRISFETYVQSMYFEQVIKAANARLSVMTGGRYELLRCQTASSLGAQTASTST